MLLGSYLYAQDSTKVLFIGNSITYFNDMPQTFEAIANSKNDLTSVTVYAPGGTGFLNHVNDANVYSHFRSEEWDYVVLQPGSNESPGYSEPIASTLTRARQLNDSIHHYNPCAKVLYYEISYGVWGSTAANLVQYNETMDLIKSNLIHLADSTQNGFVPAGEGLRTAWNADQTVMLWGSPGDIHPNQRGSYITACSFYASIFNAPSYGTTVLGGLSLQEANEYQTLADTTVLNHKPEWRLGEFDLVSDFSYMSNGVDIVNFFDNSLNADSVHWDFGDGTTSNLLNPIHTYNTVDNFDVIHTAYQNGCAKDTVLTVEIQMLSIANSQEKENFKIYPNPAQNQFELKVEKNNESFYVTVVNIAGKTVFSESIIDQTSLKVDFSNQSKGLYFVTLTSDKTSWTKKVILK